MAGVDLLSSASAVAEPRVGDQSAQVKALARLYDLIDANHLSGLAGTSLAKDGQAVEVFWAGSVPSILRSLAAQSASTQATLSIISVPYSKEQIGAHARALIAKAKQQKIPLVSVASTADFRGLHVDVEPSATLAQREELQRMGASEVGESGPLVPLSRFSDGQPFWGGAVIESSSNLCSTGFAVQNSSGTRGIATAHHCGTNTTWNTPLGARVGTSNGGHVNSDSMIITGTDYAASLYIGPWDSVQGTPINAKAEPALGQPICAGGGLSGEVCGATVTLVNAFDAAGIGPGYVATRDPSVGLAGHGDSGGPSYADPITTGNVTLLGMIISADGADAAPCNGGSSNPWNTVDRQCFFRVFFTNQSAVASGNGVVVLTSP
jgi:hypothetical protein